jgi:hypothetical protein
MTVEIIRKRLKRFFIDQKMTFESYIIDTISDAEVMKYNRKMRLKKVWAK